MLNWQKERMGSLFILLEPDGYQDFPLLLAVETWVHIIARQCKQPVFAELCHFEVKIL